MTSKENKYIGELVSRFVSHKIPENHWVKQIPILHKMECTAETNRNSYTDRMMLL